MSCFCHFAVADHVVFVFVSVDIAGYCLSSVENAIHLFCRRVWDHRSSIFSSASSVTSVHQSILHVAYRLLHHRRALQLLPTANSGDTSFVHTALHSFAYAIRIDVCVFSLPHRGRRCQCDWHGSWIMDMGTFLNSCSNRAPQIIKYSKSSFLMKIIEYISWHSYFFLRNYTKTAFRQCYYTNINRRFKLKRSLKKN